MSAPSADRPPPLPQMVTGVFFGGEFACAFCKFGPWNMHRACDMRSGVVVCIADVD